METVPLYGRRRHLGLGQARVAVGKPRRAVAAAGTVADGCRCAAIVPTSANRDDSAVAHGCMLPALGMQPEAGALQSTAR